MVSQNTKSERPKSENPKSEKPKRNYIKNIKKGLNKVGSGLGVGIGAVGTGLGAVKTGIGKSISAVGSGLGAGIGAVGSGLGAVGPVVLNQLNNTVDILKSGGSSIGNTTVNAVKTLGPVFTKGAGNTLNLIDKTGNLATNITKKGLIPLAGASAEQLINVGSGFARGVNYGIDKISKGIEYIDDKINSNQLEIYKEPKIKITVDDIYNKLISSNESELINLYNITKKLIDFKYKNNFKNTNNYTSELNNLFENLRNNPSELNYDKLAKFLFDVKNTEKKGVFSNFFSKLFNSNPISYDNLNSIKKDIEKNT